MRRADVLWACPPRAAPAPTTPNAEGRRHSGADGSEVGGDGGIHYSALLGARPTMGPGGRMSGFGLPR